MREQRWALPADWVWVKATDIARVVGGGTPPSRDAANFSIDGIRWITPADLAGHNSPYVSRGKRDLSARGYTISGARLLPKGSVLFSSRAPIGYCAIASNDLCTNQGFKSLVLADNVLPEFIRYYLLGSKEYAETFASGTTFLEISTRRMESLEFPVAPIETQRQIVAELDSQLGKIAKAQADLENIQPLIKECRASLLNLSFEGRLLSASAGNFKDRKPLSDLVEDISYGTSKKSHLEPRGTAVVRIPNVSGGEIDLRELKYSVLDENEFARLALRLGDVLVVRSNGSSELVGRPTVVNEQAVGMAFAGYLIRIRVYSQIVRPKFLSYMLQSPATRKRIENQLSSTSGVRNVNAKQLLALTIPVPPLNEQEAVVEKLDTAFAWLGRLSSECERAQGKLRLLHEKLLAKAFQPHATAGEFLEGSGEDLLQRIRLSSKPELPEPQLENQQQQLVDYQPGALILNDTQSWPAEGLPFEELARRISLDKDEMRDALFALLAGDAPSITQTFDSANGRILLKKVTP